MKYAVLDSKGRPVGFYSPEIHGEKGTAESRVPSTAIEITDEQWQELLEKQERAKVTIQNDTVIVEDVMVEKSLKTVQDEKISQVNRNRKNAIEAGMNYTFPDGIMGTIQTKDRDLRNIGFLTQAASLRLQTGSTRRIPFRDKENVTHQLDPEQFTTMSTEVFSFVSAAYEKSWTLKDDIMNETDKNVVKSMPTII